MSTRSGLIAKWRQDRDSLVAAMEGALRGIKDKRLAEFLLGQDLLTNPIAGNGVLAGYASCSWMNDTRHVRTVNRRLNQVRKAWRPFGVRISVGWSGREIVLAFTGIGPPKKRKEVVEASGRGHHSI